MNTSYDELDTDIESNVKEVNTKTECSKYKFCESCYSIIKYLLCIYLIITIILLLHYILYLINENISNETFTKGKDHLLKDNINKSTWRQLRVQFHHHNYEDPCPKYQYGCCEIFTGCDYKNENITHFTSHEFKGYYNHIIKNNAMGTNCPRLLDLVNEHNQHYPLKESCSKSNEGCCNIETGCDINFKLQDMLDDYSIEYKINYNYKYSNLVDKEGQCPSINDLMNEYRSGYPRRDYSFWQVEGSVFFIIGILLCLVLCTNK